MAKSSRIYEGTMLALLAHIRDNHAYLQGRIPGGVTAALKGIEKAVEVTVLNDCDLFAMALQMFLQKAPALSDMFAPIARRQANLSTDAIFDPLTFGGLNDILSFLHGGLYDDLWIALYENGKERRLVTETVDDCVSAGGRDWPEGGFPYLDKHLNWMIASRRTVLSDANFRTAFARDLIDVSPQIPTIAELTKIWEKRPYDDNRQ